MDYQKLQQLAGEGLSQRQIAERLGASQSNVKYWLKKFDLKTNSSRQPRPLKCKLCGETDSSMFYIHKNGYVRYRCKKCDNLETIKRFRTYKKQAVAYKGGKCVKCGYNKCLGSLDFHHRESTQKDPNWRKMRNWPIEKIKAELDKCDLVCRNCHGEIHYGDEDLPG